MRYRIAAMAGIAVGLGVAAVAFAAENFETHSQLVSSRLLATSFSIRLGQYQEIAEAATKKYGPEAKTVMHGDNGKVETTLNGKVVATDAVRARVEDVFGVFLVGRRSNDMARFPFALKVSGKRDEQRDVGRMVRSRFGKQAPQLLDFNDLDWANLWCWTEDKPDAGAQFADAQPRFGKADLCLVRWRRGEPRTMLIGGLVADGGDWVRDASQPLCRSLAAQWIVASEPGVQDSLVDYVACVLVHDPDRGTRGARKTVADHLFEVRPGGALARMN